MAVRTTCSTILEKKYLDCLVLYTVSLLLRWSSLLDRIILNIFLSNTYQNFSWKIDVYGRLPEKYVVHPFLQITWSQFRLCIRITSRALKKKDKAHPRALLHSWDSNPMGQMTQYIGARLKITVWGTFPWVGPRCHQAVRLYCAASR